MKKLMLRLTALVLCLMMLTTQALAAERIYTNDHLLLKYRNSGTCQTLTGNVRLMCVFVNLPDAKWDENAIQGRKEALSAAVNRLILEAAAYGVQVNFSAQYFTASASESTSIDGETSRWAEAVVANAPGMEPITYNNGAESYYQGMPILFFLPTGGRSFAHSETSNTLGEYLVLFEEEEPAVIRHELLHLFGARDYYVMSEIYDVAKTYVPGSIMLSTSKDENSVDSLTAYTIGWCSTPDATASSMLQATDHITQDDLDSTREEERITGYGVYERSDYTFAGMMIDGSRNGYGKISWTNGSSYEGNWVWGERTGKGTYTWADGDVYTGDFVEGERTGKGVYTWAEGETYAGDFVEGERTGKGVITWPSGNTYAGDFLDDNFTGKGIYTWENGDTYSGDYLDGNRHGKGVYTWASGNMYIGDFVDNARTGKGTFVWASGDVYTGDFVNGARTGKGTYIWANGDSYTGDFVDNVRSGTGMYVSADGEVTIGYWEDGKYLGK